MQVYHRVYNTPDSLLFIIDFDIVANGIIFRDSSKLVEISAIKRAAAKRVDFFVHGTDFLNFIVDYIISFTFISDDLVIADS